MHDFQEPDRPTVHLTTMPDSPMIIAIDGLNAYDQAGLALYSYLSRTSTGLPFS